MSGGKSESKWYELLKKAREDLDDAESERDTARQQLARARSVVRQVADSFYEHVTGEARGFDPLEQAALDAARSFLAETEPTK